MNFWIAFRLFALSVLLLVIVYFMFYMRTNGLDQMKKIFGEEQDGQRAHDISQSQLNWCDTKVRSIQYRDRFTLSEEQFQWVLLPSRKKVDSVAVTKWLGRNCTLRVERQPFVEIAPTDMVTLLQVQFVNGDSGTFFYSPAHRLYGWKGQRFTSNHLPLAEAELSGLIREVTK